MRKDLKIVLWDIETAPMLVTTWGLWKQNIPHYAIHRDWSIICACWKELGKAKVHRASIQRNPKGEHFLNDYNIVKRLRVYLEDVDILIAHNGDRFDLKKFNARLAYHGLAPLPKILTIDTLKEARKFAVFSSNKLDYLGEFLGLGRKIHTDPELWQYVVRDQNKKAVKEMTDYCAGDVELLEKVYEKLKPYMKSHPNVAMDGSLNCPKCNSDHVHKHKKRAIANSGIKRIQYHCQDCGAYFTHRYAEKDEKTGKSKVPLSKA